MSAWFLFAACATALASSPDPVGEDPTYPLDRAAYRFCHEPGYQASDARAWCELLADVPPERCPGLRRTCDDPTLQASAGCAPEALGSGDGAGAGAPEEPRQPPQGCDPPPMTPPGSAGGTLLRWVGAVAVAIVVAVILRLLVAWFGRGRAPERPVVRVVEEDVGTDVPDVPSGELLARARAALEAGDAAGAAQLARSAALRRLAETRRLVLHRSRTDREYVRAVRSSDRDLAEALAGIVAAVEALRFGGRTLDPDRAREVVRGAERIVLAALALLVLLAPADALAQGRHGPFGDAALRELYDQHGYEPRWLEGELTDVDDPPDLVVLDLAGVDIDGEDWAWLVAYVEGGGLLMLGGDGSIGFPALGGRVLLESPAPVEAEVDLPEALPVPAWPSGVDYVWVGIDAEPWVNAVGTGGGDPVPGTKRLERDERAPTVVVLRQGQGAVLAIADGRLLANGALVHPDNERFLAEAPRLLADGEPHDVLLATWSGGGDASASRGAAANPRLIPFVLQLGLTWVLLVLWRGWPFGVRRDPTDEGRARFVEHVGALAARWAQIGASGWALRASARLWLHRLGPEGLELAARRAGYDPRAARRFVADIEATARGDGEGDDPSDLDNVEELWRITSRR